MWQKDTHLHPETAERGAGSRSPQPQGHLPSRPWGGCCPASQLPRMLSVAEKGAQGASPFLNFSPVPAENCKSGGKGTENRSTLYLRLQSHPSLVSGGSFPEAGPEGRQWGKRVVWEVTTGHRSGEWGSCGRCGGPTSGPWPARARVCARGRRPEPGARPLLPHQQRRAPAGDLPSPVKGGRGEAGPGRDPGASTVTLSEKVTCHPRKRT